MTRSRMSFGESWRVLAYTLGLALAFVVLGRVELALFTAPGTQRLLQGTGLLDGNSDARLRDQAVAVADASRAAMSRAPAGHRLATLRLGYELGYASERTGFFATAPASYRERAWQLLEEQQAGAEALARELGVAPAPALRSGNLREFNELGARYEADEGGLAARIERRLSPWHRHVYLLGVHVGIETARIEATGGKHSLPPAALIRRHATLAGIDPALWQPLAAAPGDESPERWSERYRVAVQALAGSLVSGDTGSGVRQR